MKRLFTTLLLVLAVAVCPAWADEAIRLGVLAYRPKAQALAQWQPLALYLQTTLRRPVNLQVFDLIELEAAVANDALDVVLTAPSQFIALKHRYGLSAPLATQISKEAGRDLSAFGGVIFARANATNLQQLQDLAGKRIALTSTDFTGGYQMQAFEMLEAGLPSVDLSQLQTLGMPQDLTVAAVLDGRADVGFVRSGVLEALALEGKLDLALIKVIHQQNLPSFPFVSSTRLYPEWPVAVTRQFNERMNRQLAVALLSLAPDSDAAQVAGISGFSIPADYSSVETLLRRLRIAPFDAAPEFTIADFWHQYTPWIVAFLGLLALVVGAAGAWLVIQNAAVKRSQAQYKAQSRRMSEIIWSTNTGTWEWNVQTGEVTLNERWAQIIGYTLAELQPITMHTLVERTHPDDASLSDGLVQRCFSRDAKDYKCEIRMLHKNGSWVWVFNRGRVVEWTADGKPLRMSGTQADISERKRAEQREQHHSRTLAMLAKKTALAEVLNAIAIDLQTISPDALCCILLLDEDSKKLRMGAAPGLPDYFRAAIDRLGVEEGMGACGRSVFSGQRVVTKDIESDPAWTPFLDLTRNAGLASCWSQPILSTQGRALGTFALYHRTVCSPSPEDIQLLEDEARLVALVIEKTTDETSLQLAASVFRHAREGIMIADATGTIIEVNETFTHITGYSRAEAIGQNPRMLHSGRQDSNFYTQMWSTLAEHGHWSGEVWNRRKNGEIYPETLTLSAVRDASGTTKNYVALFTDITDTKIQQQRLEQFAHFDALTGLPNRVLLADRLKQAMLQSQRRSQALAVVYLDLDGFKAVNDLYSHSVGDELLIALSLRMKSALRDGDTLARIGGDEFVAVLVDLEHPQACEAVLERLLLAAASPVTVDGNTLTVSASIGVTQYPSDLVDADQLMRHADQAMYIAKVAGKNRYHHFDVEQDAAVKTQRQDLDAIRYALEQNEFVLFYQPKVNMATGVVTGAEALIRWQHPEKGLLPPSEFLGVIENYPISVELGEWVIDTALAQMAAWARAGLHFPISVNVGVRQLQQGDFVERLTTLLQAHPDVPPLSLELEVLETSAMEDIGHVSNVMNACRALGVGFALDDFGTGYSSLTYLKHLPAELLKIDQSFVRDMLDDPDDLAIVEGVIGLATAFRRNVIAEGVETVAHGELLLNLGCQMAQGYGIARPMPASSLPDWVAKWRPDPSWSNWHDRALSRDDKAIVFIEVGHRHWLRTVEAFVSGGRSTPPPMESSECHFGRWQVSDGQARFGKNPRFWELVDLHERIHHSATGLISATQLGTEPPHGTGIAELRVLLDALSVKLRELVRA